jgi:hypothetical protein
MTTVFERVLPVGVGNDVSSEIENWIGSEPIRAVVRAFGGDDDVFSGNLSDQLASLDAFTDRWDTRQGKERDLAGELHLTEDQEDLVIAAATALGFRESAPPRHRDYQHVMLLGGLFRACMTRPAYAARLIQDGVVETESVTALGGYRAFSEPERELAANAGFPNIDDEFAALDIGTRTAFRLGKAISVDGERFENPGGSWGVNEYREVSGILIRVAAAPSSQPEERRANTADSYAWFARTLAKLKKGDRVLAVTTSIYVPAQQAAAIRMLNVPFGVEVETVGIEPGDVIPSLAQKFTPTKYLLEIRSALRSLRDLHRVLTTS